jgi:transposase
MDMWDQYISSTIEHVSGTHGKTLFDSFHVMRLVNEAVDSVRKEENRELVKKCIMDLNVQGMYGCIHSRTFRKSTGNVAIS